MQQPRITFFFRVWVTLLIVLAVVIVGGQLWLAATILTNPTVVGEWLGEVLAGVRAGVSK